MRSLRPSASRLRTGARLLEHCELKALLCPQRGAPLERVNPAYVARRPDLRAESAAMQHSPSFLGCDARACRSAAKVMPPSESENDVTQRSGRVGLRRS